MPWGFCPWGFGPASMQALGLVRISQKQNLIEILFKKMAECKIMWLGRFSFPSQQLPKKGANLWQQVLPPFLGVLYLMLIFFIFNTYLNTYMHIKYLYI